MEKQIFFSATVQKSPVSIPARVMVEQSLDRVVYRDLEKRTMELLPTTSFKLFNQLRNNAIDEHIIVRHDGAFSRYTLTGQELPFPGNS